VQHGLAVSKKLGKLYTFVQLLLGQLVAIGLCDKTISLSHAMRPRLIRHFWVANRAGPENHNKFKERVLKK
jgi:hypothetical protein